MAVENLFPNYKGCNGIDGNRQHAEATEAVQAAWDRTVAANARNELEADARRKAIKKLEEVRPVGCVFAKSCTLPDGIINHSNSGGFIPLELLNQYGAYAVLGASSAASAAGTALQWIGGSGSAMELAKRLGGTLSTLAPPNVKIIVGMVLPNTTSPDSAFYTSEQYAELTEANTRVRVNVKHLPDGAVSLYGFYTGTKREWQNVPVIKAEASGDQMVADFGDGIKIIWTPAVDPNAVLGIPALEGVTLSPAAWVFPPGEKADQILINPAYPPDYQDAIIWFPSQPQIAPIYLSLSIRRGEPGVVTGIGENVPGEWLDHARTGLGVPIPTSIADTLRGRSFSSFDSFRRAFWVSVSRDPKLSEQIAQRELDRMRAGRAPRSRRIDWAGSRISHDIHHVEPISEGGEVYNVDNLRVNTPKNHVEVHKN